MNYENGRLAKYLKYRMWSPKSGLRVIVGLDYWDKSDFEDMPLASGVAPLAVKYLLETHAMLDNFYRLARAWIASFGDKEADNDRPPSEFIEFALSQGYRPAWLDWAIERGLYADEKAPAVKVEAGTVTMMGDTAEHDETLAALFDPMPVAALEKTFPANGRWKCWAERAARNGLKDAAKEGRGTFNPYNAAVWFVNQGMEGWDLARCYRVLANNLPARSLENKHLLTGNID